MTGKLKVFLCLTIIFVYWGNFFEAEGQLSKAYSSDISFEEFNPNKTINYTFAGNLADKVASFPKNTTEDIIKIRIEKSIEYKEDTYAYSIARDIVPGCKNLAAISQVCAINDYLKKGDGKRKKWDYVNDPRGVDSFQNAGLSLKYGGDTSVGKGDCDDYAIVVSSLIECIGGASLIVFAEKEGKGAHMYTEVYLGKFGVDDDNVKKIIKWLSGNYKNSSTSNIVVDYDLQKKEYWLNLDWDYPYPGGIKGKYSKYVSIRVRENESKFPLDLANEKPDPMINYDKNLLFAEEEIWFDASGSKDEDGNIIKYEWTFGDNSSHSDSINSTHIYDKPGNYNVSLNVTDNMGDSNSTRLLLSVGKPRIFDLAYKPKAPEPGDIVTFNASGMKVKKYYNWSFGDKEFQEGPDLATCTHRYLKAESYWVNLTTIDNSDRFKNISSLIVINEPPHAKFEWSPAKPNEKEKIAFTAKDSYDTEGPIESYFWSFGDGTNATGKEVSHSYDYGGEYLIRFSVKDKAGSINETQTIININSPPIAYFSFNPPGPTTENTVKFDASLSSDPNPFGTIKAYEWDFGDNSPVERGKFAEHKYKKEGNYTVKLTVIDDKNLKNTQSLLVEVRKNVRNPPRAYLIYAPDQPTTDDYVTFDATWSTDLDGYIKEYKWELSDGNTSDKNSFQHKFQREGEYTANLTVTDDDNLNYTQSQTITVGKPENPAAIISCQSDRTEAGKEVTFNASSSQGDILSYLWDFGDNTTGKEEAIVKHTYEPGNLKTVTYNVTLTVHDKKGRKNSTIRNFTVDPAKVEPLVPDFTYSPEHPGAGQEITFNASMSKGSIRSYEWNFDDGSPMGSEKIEKHTFPTNESGTVIYEVTLTLTDIIGEKHHKSKDVSVSPPPPPPLQSSYTFQPENPTVGQEVVFDGSASQGTVSNYLWDFGDGSPTRDGAIVTHAFTASPYKSKTYDVTLSAADKAGKKYPLTKKVTVLPPKFPTINSLWIDYNNQKRQYLTCPLYTQVRLIANSQGGNAIMKEYYKPDPGQEPDNTYNFNYGTNEIVFGADRLGEHILAYNINGQLSNIVVIYVVEQGQVEGSISPAHGSYSQPNSAFPSSSQAQPIYLGHSSSSSSGQSTYPGQPYSSFPSHYPGQSSSSLSDYNTLESPYSGEDWL